MSTDYSPQFKGGFSFRDNVVGKPPERDLSGLMLGDQWIWAPEAQPQHLLYAVAVKGYAVSPAKWANGYKSKKKGRFLESSYLLLDYDANLSWEAAKQNPFFNQYTVLPTPVHLIRSLARVIGSGSSLRLMLSSLMPRCLTV